MVLAKWLESVTVLVAERKPHDEHAQFLALFFSYVYMFHWSFSENILCLCSGYVLQFLSIWLRCALR